jgi:hypothetical protein
MKFTDLQTRVFTAGEALAAYRLVIMSNNEVVLADAGDTAVMGSTGIDGAVADGADVNVRLWNASGTRRLTAGGAITAGAAVAVAADGKVVALTDEANGYGVALESAAADGDVIEVLSLGAMYVMPTGS